MQSVSGGNVRWMRCCNIITKPNAVMVKNKLINNLVISDTFISWAKPPNGLRYLRVGWRVISLDSGILFGCKKAYFSGRLPTRQVRVLFGGFLV